MGKVASVIDTYFKTLICTKSSGMVQKPWHTRENSYDPADEEYADDILGLSTQEKYVRLRMEQTERTILEGLNSIERVAERLPTSKFWTTMNDEEKAVRLKK